MEDIKNFTAYNNRMSKALLDKIFFLDKIESEIFVDYGCADGELLRHIYHFSPQGTKLLGYDISEKMISKGASNSIGVGFTTNWKMVEKALKNIDGKKTLILSSILHEIHSYCNATEINEFWDRVYNTGFDYISIRDMSVSNEIATLKTSDYDYGMMTIKAIRPYIKSFTKEWGTTQNKKNFIHFLLKYRYTDNWSHELKENYLSLPFETLINKIPAKYKPIYLERYTLPYIHQIVKEDFDINLTEKTHVKLILQKQ